MGLIVGVKDDDEEQAEEESKPELAEPEGPPAVRYKPKPLGSWVQVEPMPPSKEELKSRGGIIMVSGVGARRKAEMAESEEHTKFKMTHSRVVAVGPDVTRVKVGDVVKFVGHPQCQMTGEAVQEAIVNLENGTDYVNFIQESTIYCVLAPIAPELKVLQ